MINTIYVGMVMLIHAICAYYAVKLTYNWDLFAGFIFIAITVAMFFGYKIPDPTKQEVWLVTVLGKRTVMVARLITFLFPGVGKIAISSAIKNHDFKLPKEIRCFDGIYVNGNVSVAFGADTNSDPFTKSNRKSAGKKLRDYDTHGQREGITSNLNDMIFVSLQRIALMPGHTALWMEGNPAKVESLLCEMLAGGLKEDDSMLDDIRDFGIEITKLQCVLSRRQEVINAANDKAVEQHQRDADLADQRALTAQIDELLKHNADNRAPGEPPLTYREAYAHAMELRVTKQGKAQKISNPGGINVADATSKK